MSRERCPACGALSFAGARTCAWCGAVIDGPAPAQEPPPPTVYVDYDPELEKVADLVRRERDRRRVGVAVTWILAATVVGGAFASVYVMYPKWVEAKGDAIASWVAEKYRGAPTAQEVQKRSRAAAGTPVQRKVDTVYMRGFVGDNGDVPFAIYARRPSSVRLEIGFPGQVHVACVDGGSGWTRDPKTGRIDLLPPADAESLRTTGEALFEEDPEELGGQMLGVFSVRGIDTYGVRGLNRKGKVETRYYDCTSYALVQRKLHAGTSMDGDPGAEVMVTTTLGSLEMNGEIVESDVTMSQPNGQALTMRMTALELNPELAPDTFAAYPAPSPPAEERRWDT